MDLLFKVERYYKFGKVKFVKDYYIKFYIVFFFKSYWYVIWMCFGFYWWIFDRVGWRYKIWNVLILWWKDFCSKLYNVWLIGVFEVYCFNV